MAHDDLHYQRIMCVSISWAVFFLFLKRFLSPPVPRMGLHLSDLPWGENLRFSLAVTPLGISLTLKPRSPWVAVRWCLVATVLICSVLPFSLHGTLSELTAIFSSSYQPPDGPPLLPQPSSLNRSLELLSTYSRYLSLNPSQACCPIKYPPHLISSWCCLSE